MNQQAMNQQAMMSMCIMTSYRDLIRAVNERREVCNLSEDYRPHISMMTLRILQSFDDKVKTEIETYAKSIFENPEGVLAPVRGFDGFKEWDNANTGARYYVKLYKPDENWKITITENRVKIYTFIAEKLGYVAKKYDAREDGDDVVISYQRLYSKEWHDVLRIPKHSWGRENIQYHVTVMQSTYDKERYSSGYEFQRLLSENRKRGGQNPFYFPPLAQPDEVVCSFRRC